MDKVNKSTYYSTRHLIPENLESARQSLKSQLEVLKSNTRGVVILQPVESSETKPKATSVTVS